LTRSLPAGICILAMLTACDWKPEKEKDTRIIQRTDYSPDEFGMGRRHTPNRGCNRDIDALLNEIRLCLKNYGVSDKCDNVQKKASKKISHMKHTIRCAR